MKINFKKVSAIVGSFLMVGMTCGTAMAANYPAPFASSGNADVAIVYGTGSGVSSLDLIQAGNIQSNLQSYMSGSSSDSSDTVTGDSVLLEKAATKFSLGKGILDVVSGTLTDDDLSHILSDGTYLDENNDEHEYTQKIVLGNNTLSLFDDNDYKEDTPTVGVAVSSGTHILNYTLEFSSNPYWADLTNTEIEIMGKSYFISSVTANTTINLLDAANTATVYEGESVSVNVGDEEYTVEVIALSGAASAPQVKLSVNGQTTNSLSEGNTYKLSDGTYVGIKDISMRDVAGTSASVEFSLGTGKIELRHTMPVKINDKTINDLNTYIINASGSSGDQLNKIIIQWNADEDVFATEDSSIILPGLENVKISSTGMYYPTEEIISVEKGSNTYIQLNDVPLKSGTADIDILYGNGTSYTGVGKEATKKLLTSDGQSITFDGDEHQYFIATYDDASNAESYLMRATSFGVKSDGTTNTTDIQYYSDGSWVSKKSEAALGDTVNLGSVSLTISTIDRNGKSVEINTSGNVNFNTLVTKEGLKMYLPIENVSNNYTLTGLGTWHLPTNATGIGFDATRTTSYALGFLEETKTGATTGGKQFNATLGWTSLKTTVSDIVGETPNGGYEIEDTDVMRSFIYGDLATEILYDTSGDQDSAKIIYHGDEAYGRIYVSEIGATITAGTTTSAGTQLGDVLVKDSEVSSVSSKNLIVVGGSCVNSVAANLLGSTCGADFTEKTSVGSGEFLIQSLASPYSSSKVALVVAGYEAADTVNAATYLRTQTVDTTAGKKYKGTSATSAQLVTTSE